MEEGNLTGRIISEPTHSPEVSDLFAPVSHPRCELVQRATPAWSIIASRYGNDAVVDIQANEFRTFSSRIGILGAGKKLEYCATAHRSDLRGSPFSCPFNVCDR